MTAEGARSEAVDVTIRVAGPNDAQLAADLLREVFIETFGPSNKAENMEAYVREAFDVARVRSELADASSMSFLAEADRTVAGFARLEMGAAPEAVEGRRPVELVRLYVRSRFHGTPVAAALMRRCMDAGRERGRDVMHLGVWEHNARARAFYVKWGFERVGTQAFQLGDETQTDYVYARKL